MLGFFYVNLLVVVVMVFFLYFLKLISVNEVNSYILVFFKKIFCKIFCFLDYLIILLLS